MAKKTTSAVISTTAKKWTTGKELVQWVKARKKVINNNSK